MLCFHNNNQCFYTVERYVEVNNTKCTHCCVAMATIVNQTCHDVRSCCMACQLRFRSSLAQGWPRAGSGPGENSFSPPTNPERANRLKICTIIRKDCRLQSDLGWSERVNVYGRQLMVLPRETKTYATQSGPPVPHSRLSVSGNLDRLPPPFSRYCSG